MGHLCVSIFSNLICIFILPGNLHVAQFQVILKCCHVLVEIFGKEDVSSAPSREDYVGLFSKITWLNWFHIILLTSINILNVIYLKMSTFLALCLWSCICKSFNQTLMLYQEKKYAGLYFRTRTKCKTIYTCMLLSQSPHPSPSKGVAVSNAANFIMLCCHICAWYLDICLILNFNPAIHWKHCMICLPIGCVVSLLCVDLCYMVLVLPLTKPG